MERELTLGGGDLFVCHLGDLSPGDGGKVLEFSLRLTGVLPERRTAVAVAVVERDEKGREFSRGTRMLTVPPHHSGEARDIVVKPVRFLLPGELAVSGDGVRRLAVRADAHYIDGNESCFLPDP